jgi:acyl-CoA synthetase (NDP forming)
MSEWITVRSDQLQKIFWAKSVAVLGASTNPAKLGHIILRNIIEGGYDGSLYPINPNAHEVLGLTAYTDLLSIPTDVDLVVFVVPGPMIPTLLEQAKEKKAGGAIVISGGFREVGNDALEHEVLVTARRCSIRMIGPNCQGFTFRPNKLCASWPLITRRGSIAIISQSGTIAATLAGWAEQDSVGVSGVVSLGNQADLCEIDFIQAFGEDVETKVIVMYIEGVKYGRQFMDTVTQINKPIIVLKSGRTPSGEKAAASHTKSMAGRDDVFSGICEQAGIIRAATIEEAYDFAKGFNSIPAPLGNRLLIITSSGGSGILAVDVAENHGLRILSLEAMLKEDLRKSKLPHARVIGNPIDLTGDASIADYLEVLRVCETRDAADMYLIIFGDPIAGAAEGIKKATQQYKKPLGICYLGGGTVQSDELKNFSDLELPVFPTPERATRLLAALYHRQSLKENYP